MPSAPIATAGNMPSTPGPSGLRAPVEGYTAVRTVIPNPSLHRQATLIDPMTEALASELYEKSSKTTINTLRKASLIALATYKLKQTLKPTTSMTVGELRTAIHNDVRYYFFHTILDSINLCRFL